MALRTSEDKYKEFVKKRGKPTYLTEELAAVGVHNFVPFINTGCARNTCVYDLSHIENCYGQKYDLTDEFQANAEMDCHYCDEHIKFGNFYTAQTLTEDVEDLFHKELTLKKDADSKATNRSPYTRKSNAFRGEKAGEEGAPRKKTILNFVSNTGSKTDVASFMGNFLSRQVKRRSGGLISDQEGLKLKLKNYEVPDYHPKANSILQQFSQEIIQSKPSQFKTVALDNFVLGDLLEAMPTYKEIQDFIAGRQESVAMVNLLLAYWRVRLCQQSGKLMNVWMYDVQQRQFSSAMLKRSDALFLDNTIIANNSDSNYVNLIFRINLEYHLVELNKISGELAYINFQSAKDHSMKSPSDISKLSDSAFFYFEKANKEFFREELDINSKRIENFKVSCSKQYALSYFILEKFFGSDIRILGQVDSCVAQVLMDLKLFHPTGSQAELSISVGNSEKVDSLKVQNEPLVSPSNSIGPQSLQGSVGGSLDNYKPKSSKYLNVNQNSSPQIPDAHFRRPSESGFKRRLDELNKPKEIPKAEKEKKFIHIRRPSGASTLQLDDSLLGIQTGSIKKPVPEKPKLLQPKPVKEKKIFPSPERIKPAVVFKINKNNKIPDGSLSVQKKEQSETEPEDIKKLLNFYYAHDRSRYKYLLTKCQSNFGENFLSKMNLSKSSNTAIKNEGPGLGRKLRFDEGNKLVRLGSSDTNGNLETQDSPKKGSKPLHRPTFSMDIQTNNNKSLPKLGVHNTSDGVANKNSILKKKNSSEQNLAYNSIGNSMRGSLRNLIDLEMGHEIREQNFNSILQFMEQQYLKGLLGPKGNEDQKVYLFRTDFFTSLVGDLNQEVYSIKHKKVLQYTQTYDGKGNTIFDCFKRVIIPICHELEGIFVYSMVVVEAKGREVKLFDPILSQSKSKFAKNYTRSIVKYIMKEIELRTGESTDKSDITVSDLPSPREKDASESGNWVLFLISKLLQGNYPLKYSKDEKNKFLQQMNNLLHSSS